MSSAEAGVQHRHGGYPPAHGVGPQRRGPHETASAPARTSGCADESRSAGRAPAATGRAGSGTSGVLSERGCERRVMGGMPTSSWACHPPHHKNLYVIPLSAPVQTGAARRSGENGEIRLGRQRRPIAAPSGGGAGTGSGAAGRNGSPRRTGLRSGPDRRKRACRARGDGPRRHNLRAVARAHGVVAMMNRREADGGFALDDRLCRVDPLAAAFQVALDLGLQIVHVIKQDLFDIADGGVEVARHGDVEDQRQPELAARAGRVGTARR